MSLLPTRAALAVAVPFVTLLAACVGSEGEPASEAAGGARHKPAWVATANQLGVVGYRDPVGAISPNGSLVAYAEGRRVRVVPAAGGASRPMDPADGQVRHLAWLDDVSLLAEDRDGSVRWWRYDVGSGEREPLWPGRTASAAGSDREIGFDRLSSLAVSGDGTRIAGIVSTEQGWELWQVDRAGDQAEVTDVGRDRVFYPTFTRAGEVACVVRAGGRYRLHLPCGEQEIPMQGDRDVVGPLAFGRSDATVYFASPDGTGMVELMVGELGTGSVRQIAGFSRDTYAPSITGDGARLLFRSQSYRTFVAEIDVESGAHRQLALFQSETPSYSPDGDLVAFTFGTWRRQLDDVNYPDIAQHIGLVRSGAENVGATEPIEVIASSESEDQAMDWSPNGRWIALHSHREGSDDVWLRPRDGSSPDRQITFLGRGAEVGWPRWSPDGETVLVNGASPIDGSSVLFTVGVDQESGQVTRELAQIAVDDLDAEIGHAEWLPDSRTVVAIAKEGPGRHVIFTVPAAGGAAQVVRRFESEHDFPGLALRRDGTEVAFIAPAPDGFFQLFRMPLAGGAATQVTFDPVHKTQPSWSPDGGSLAYTVWDYRSQFWLLDVG